MHVALPLLVVAFPLPPPRIPTPPRPLLPPTSGLTALRASCSIIIMFYPVTHGSFYTIKSVRLLKDSLCYFKSDIVLVTLMCGSLQYYVMLFKIVGMCFDLTAKYNQKNSVLNVRFCI